MQRGAAVVRQLLTFARKDGVSFQVIDVNDVANECANIVRETFPKNIELSLELSPRLPAIKADPNQLHQSLLNLCVNARDAMPDGGRLAIATDLSELETVRQSCPDANEPRYVHIRISDTGGGMDEATKSRIFEPFFTTKGTGKGSGLGLPVVYGIVQGHRGCIGVETKPGKGTTFDLFLPAREPRVKDRPRDSAKKAVSTGGAEKILVVEDEEMLRVSLRSLLESEGYSVRTACDGVEALELYRREAADIDLVVLDHELPRLSGWDAFRGMREWNPRAEAILASGHVERHRVTQMLAGGARAVVGKPYTADAILSKIREVIDTIAREGAGDLPKVPFGTAPRA